MFNGPTNITEVNDNVASGPTSLADRPAAPKPPIILTIETNYSGKIDSRQVGAGDDATAGSPDPIKGSSFGPRKPEDHAESPVATAPVGMTVINFGQFT